MTARTINHQQKDQHMTAIKIDSKVITDVAEALEPYADEMFKRRAGHWMAVVELAHSERTEPGPEEDKDPSVKIRIVGIEVAAGAVAEERLREAQQSLYTVRTSGGTLDEAAGEYRAGDILRNGTGLLVSTDA